MNFMDLNGLSGSLTDAVRQAAPFIASVHGNERLPSSGVLWGNGVIVTADHTLRRDEDLPITLPDNSKASAKLLGRDPGTDLAVLAVDGLPTAAPAFANPAGIAVGNVVLAVGRRGENGPCASFGIVSALGGPWRTWRNGQIGRFVRADLNLYPGSSGSALVNTQGEVIGVTTSGLTRNWSVTVPRETVDAVIQSLLAHGHVARGFLGIGLHPVRLPDGQNGLIVLSVDPDGPNARSGVLIGDVLLVLEGSPTTDPEDVQTHLGPGQVGKSIPATVSRGGAVQEIALPVGSRPKDRR